MKFLQINPNFIRFKLTFAFILVAFCCILDIDASANVKTISDFCALLQKINTIEAEFTESALGDPSLHGFLYLKKPNHIAIDYQSKDTNVKIVVNRDKVQFLDRKTGQVTHLNDNSYNVFNFLINDLKSCQAKKYQIKEDDLNVMICMVEKVEEQKYQYCVAFNKNSDVLDSLLIYKHNTTNNQFIPDRMMHFSSVKINQVLKNDIFVIKDPRLFDNEL